MICIYDVKATDFSTNGLGPLSPIEATVEETYNGMYEATLVHPVLPDGRWQRIARGNIIKLPVPVTAISVQQFVPQGETLQEYITRTTTGQRLNMRAAPSMTAKILGSYKNGTKVSVYEFSQDGDWAHVMVNDGGANGWMWADDIVPANTLLTVVASGDPETVTVEPSREQLFRIYSVELDDRSGIVRVQARHIFYDLTHDNVFGEYTPEKADIRTVVAKLYGDAIAYHGGTNPFTCQISSGIPQGTYISGDYTDVSTANAMLDPDTGVIAQAKARFVRDNFTAYVVPDEAVNRGVVIRRGKNLKGVTVKTDDSETATVVVPYGKAKNGGRLYLDSPHTVESPNVDEYPIKYIKRISYDISVVDGEADPEKGEYTTEAAAKAALVEAVENDFAEGLDKPKYTMDVDFIPCVSFDPEYRKLQAVFLGDLVTVKDSVIGLDSAQMVTHYKWDALAERYTEITLGDAANFETRIYGFQIADNSITAKKFTRSARA